MGFAFRKYSKSNIPFPGSSFAASCRGRADHHLFVNIGEKFSAVTSLIPLIPLLFTIMIESLVFTTSLFEIVVMVIQKI